MKKYIFISFTLLLFVCNLKAQTGFESFLLADKNDSQQLIKAYFSPRINAFKSALNNGWYHTAKTHKPFGFDFSINLNSVVIPSNSKSFNLSGLSSINQPLGTVKTVSAVGLENSSIINVNTNINNESVSASFNAPEGNSGKYFSNTISTPIAQLNIGLSHNFDFMLRFMPEIKPNNNNESLNILGVGLKKEITNWFPSIKKLPLHISLLAAYTTMNVNYGVKDRELPSGNASGLETKNGLTAFNLNTFTLQTLVSYDWSSFNLYGGFAYNNSNASYKTLGEFKGQYEGNSNSITKNLDTTNSSKFNSNGFSSTLGARLSLRYLKIFSSYTLQEFSSFNLGVAISIK
ncbi:hypothetical protein H9I45_14035 [Polaribacter haliotis]|uniref:Outer membrane protein beta-barrel domain-containing protein n=1 Tax=Polaribacter haliotis TaxID=1888915 RepID=A0A7L8AEJ8_9FLAO|nr:DUF6588 family protein [Polaribacter haliotis]QOD60448.1 hypothetical protein H9I45_14035 [Polaribacter haliotis]